VEVLRGYNVLLAVSLCICATSIMFLHVQILLLKYAVDVCLT
jgi:hypothetical protein